MNAPTPSVEAGRQIHERPAKARPISVTPEDERELLNAMQAYKQRSGRLFPTCSEILEVLCSLGYARRIWKPVSAWSPIAVALESTDNRPGELVEVLGWFSRVETPVGS